MRTKSPVPAAVFLPALVLVGLSGVLVGSPESGDDFPHEAHEGLFPLCEGCHRGAVTGDEDELFPPAASCTECHDGIREEPVDWTPPARRTSSLRFSHPEHQALVVEAGETATCRTCHAPDDPPVRMAVTAAPAEGCLACHVHREEAHLAREAECAVCHVPLPEAEELPVQRIAAFPVPASHEDPDFLSRHAPETALEQISCATCHARNTCERCHANADRLEEITALERDERVAVLEEDREAEYPVPESHLDRDWSWDHGATAMAEPARCGNCHTRPSCTVCHIGDGNGGGSEAAAPTARYGPPVEAAPDTLPAADTVEAIIRALPRPVPGGPRGVDLSGADERVHPPDFADRHAAFAATGAMQCTSCHIQQYCADCHAGTDSRDFHPDNFMERHALEVFAGGADCQSCHSTEAFCRDCHVQVGVAADGSRDAAFHSAEPNWILTHGQAARIGLESCAACHGQTDCLECHSAVGGWGVDPHGPGFDPEGMAARNRVTCRWCHLGDPVGGP